MRDAVADLVRDGDTVAIEGFTHLISFAAGHEIIRQRKRDLTLAPLTPDLIYDQMIAAGVARKLVFSWLGNPGVGGLGAIRRRIEGEIPAEPLEIEEYSHFGMVGRYTAGAMNIPFFPLRSYFETDLPVANPLIRPIKSPYGDETIYAVPPLRPDVTIVHAQRASAGGDTQVWGLLGCQKEAGRVEPVRHRIRRSRGAGRRAHGGWCLVPQRDRDRSGWQADPRRRPGRQPDRALRATTMTEAVAFSKSEMMIVAAARELAEQHVCFVGVGLPNIAVNLAKRTVAPDLELVYEAGVFGARPARLPLSIGDPSIVTGATAVVSMLELFGYYLQRGLIDVGFLGAAQIDRFGNINTTVIGPYDHPTTRLPGSGGACEIAINARQVFVIMRQSKRSFVETIDFRTSPGNLGEAEQAERIRREGGWLGRGPSVVVTDLGIYHFDETGEMRLDSLHPGATVEGVRETIGWELSDVEDRPVRGESRTTVVAPTRDVVTSWLHSATSRPTSTRSGRSARSSGGSASTSPSSSLTAPRSSSGSSRYRRLRRWPSATSATSASTPRCSRTRSSTWPRPGWSRAPARNATGERS